jgi:hypothetical protein
VVAPPRRGRFINAPERGNRIAVELRGREIRLFAGTVEVERYTVTNLLAGRGCTGYGWRGGGDLPRPARNRPG